MNNKLLSIIAVFIGIILPMKTSAQMGDNISAPEFNFEGDNLVMTCATQGAVIYYAMSEYADEDQAYELVDNMYVTEYSEVYTQPIPITKNVVIKAMARIPQQQGESEVTTLIYSYTAWSGLLEAMEYGYSVQARAQDSPLVSQDLKEHLQWALEEGQMIYEHRGEMPDSHEAEHFTQEIMEIAHEIEELIGNTPDIPAEYGNRMLALWRQVDGKEYRLYKAINRDRYRPNADGWNFYQTRLTLDIVNGSDTTKLVLDDGTIYTDETQYNDGATFSMMIDKEHNMMYVFTNSKTNDVNYVMEGYAYVSSLNQPAFRKETVFDYANWGWSSYFKGTTDNGQPILSHFSYSGYYDMESIRNEEGSWYSEYIGDMMPDESVARWRTINKITVIGDTSADEATIDGFVYTLRGNNESAVSWVNDKTQLEQFELPSQITVGGTTREVTAIAPFAFYECYDLQKLTLPATVTQIEESALFRCNSLKDLHVNSDTPPRLKNDYEEVTQFSDVNDCLLHSTTYGLAKKYRNTVGWNLFANVTDGYVAWVSGEDILRRALTEQSAQTIASIVWNDSIPLTADMLQGINNPNLLVYVNEPSFAPQGIQNVVVNDQAQEIVLTDATQGNNNWYCPQPFKAEKISYTRNFQQQTEVGISRGWESIALPFTVQTITHATQGQITPFGTNNGKHFWLRGYSPEGLHRATVLEANTPYVISMPNNTVIYPSEYNLNGRVTFAADDAIVPATPDIEEMFVIRGDIGMVSNYLYIPQNEFIYAVNVGQIHERYAEGSVFARNYRDLRPFEAYTVHAEVNGARPKNIRIAAQPREDITGIKDIRTDSIETPWYSLDGRQMQNQPNRKGVYIQNGKKLVVK